MPEVVRQHAADFADGHPDANLLSAFAENALIQREREAVAAHLAWCADCRECLATAFVPVAGASEPVRARLTPRLWWSVTATAAACCVVSVVWFVRQPVRQEAYIRAVRAPAAPAMPPRLAPPAEKILPLRAASPRKQQLKPGVRLFVPPPALAIQPAVPAPARVFDQVMDTPQPPLNLGAAQQTVSITGAVEPASSAARLAPVAPKPQVADHSFALREEPPASARSAPMMAGTPENTAVFRDSKKKRAAVPAASESAQWTVNDSPGLAAKASGVVQRSSDGGNTWVTVAIDPTVSFRAVSASAADIWAGGSGGALYHSSDAGVHWTRVPVSDGAATLTTVISRIEARHPPTVSVTTLYGERWTSTDFGRIWKRE